MEKGARVALGTIILDLLRRLSSSKKPSILFALTIFSLLFFPFSSLVAQYTLCFHPDGLWAELDYVSWKIKDSPNVIPLVVRGPVVPDGSPTYNQPGTKVVLGNKEISNDWRPGARFTAGYWFDPQLCYGLVSSYFFIAAEQRQHCIFSSGRAGSSFLTIPFFDTNLDAESSVTIARPGAFMGEASLKLYQRMQSWDLNAATTYYSSCTTYMQLLGGFRYWDYIERLKFNTSSPYIPPNPSDIFQTKDRFYVRNQFFGGQIGAELDYFYRGLVFDLKGKVGLGALYQATDIHGKLLTNDFNGFGAPITYNGGYFALPSNIGHNRRTVLAVLTDISANIVYPVTDCFGLRIGYSFFAVSDVLRAAKQMSRRINPTQSAAIAYTAAPSLEGPAKPKAHMRTEWLWAQGISVGFDLNY